MAFDLLTLKLVRIIVRGIRNLLTNFDVSGTFRSRLMGLLSDAPRDIATLIFDLEWWIYHGDMGLRPPSVYQV